MNVRSINILYCQRIVNFRYQQVWCPLPLKRNYKNSISQSFWIQLRGRKEWMRRPILMLWVLMSKCYVLYKIPWHQCIGVSLNRDPETLPASNYLVIQTPGDNFGAGIPPGAVSGSVHQASGTPSVSGSVQSPAQPVPPFGPASAPPPQPSSKGASLVSC